MGDVYFYQLTRSPLEVALPQLLARASGQGWRVAVRLTSAERLDWLDQKLWLGPEDGFLPHAIAGTKHEEAQPVLLCMGPDLPKGCDCLMIADGAALTTAEAAAAKRACILFDGNNEAALAHARSQWKELTDAGLAAQYWSEEDGSWRKKAESKPVQKSG
ncbi:MAG: DNA polymerase III subunit chi [Paracoccaceae bacterium]